MKLIDKMANDIVIDAHPALDIRAIYKAGFLAAKEMATKVVDSYTYSPGINGSRITEGTDILNEINAIGEEEV